MLDRPYRGTIGRSREVLADAGGLGLGRDQRVLGDLDVVEGRRERPLYAGDLNRSMQHLDSEYREEDVASTG